MLEIRRNEETKENQNEKIYPLPFQRVAFVEEIIVHSTDKVFWTQYSL
jgi:hypothetical protein